MGQENATAVTDRLDCGALYALLLQRAATDAVFIDWTGERYEYRSLVADIHQCCALFDLIELTPASFILIQTANERIAIHGFAAALLDGHVPVMLAPNTAEPRLRAIVDLVKPALIMIDMASCTGREWLSGHSVVAVTDDDRRPIRLMGRLLDLGGLTESKDPKGDRVQRHPRCASKPGDLAYVLFTSGTTSTPKGVMVTHRNLFAHLATLSRVFAYNRTSAIFNGLVLAHGDGLVQGPLLAMANGCRLIRPPVFSIHTLERYLSLIREAHTTHFISVPTIYRFIDRYARRDDYFDFAEFSALISVAAKLDGRLWRGLEARFRQPVYNMYGLTETVASALYAGPGAELGPVGTIGKPIDIDIWLVRSDGTAPPKGEPGRSGCAETMFLPAISPILAPRRKSTTEIG